MKQYITANQATDMGRNSRWSCKVDHVISPQGETIRCRDLLPHSAWCKSSQQELILCSTKKRNILELVATNMTRQGLPEVVQFLVMFTSSLLHVLKWTEVLSLSSILHFDLRSTREYKRRLCIVISYFPRECAQETFFIRPRRYTDSANKSIVRNITSLYLNLNTIN